jgi:hypothetical protein
MTELFMKDPLDLTKEDIESIIKHYRDLRATFKATPAAVKKSGPAEPKLTENQKAAQKLDLDLDLGL